MSTQPKFDVEAHIGEQTDFDAYEVTCARCGKLGLCTEFVVEEGDEWECPECNARENARERAASKRSVRAKLDALIDWYEKNNPEQGRAIRVNAAPDTVRRFAKRAHRGGPFVYRERELIPVGSKRKARAARP